MTALSMMTETTTTTAPTILRHGDKVRFELEAIFGTRYEWTFDLFELYGYLLEEISSKPALLARLEAVGMTTAELAREQYDEEVARFGADSALSLRPEAAVLAIYSDEQKAEIRATRAAQPRLALGDRVQIRGTVYEIAKVTRDGVKLAPVA